MQKKINYILWGIVFLLLLGFSIFGVYQNSKRLKMASRSYFYMNTQIFIKLYDQDTEKMDDAFEKIDQLYQEYHQLTDRYQEYKGIHNIYYLHNNQSTEDYITIDPRLYQILKLSQEWYQKSHHKFDITLGNIIDIWKKYREQGTGVPSLEELTSVSASSMKELELKEPNQIRNNHLNLDLGGVAKGYATEEVKLLLETMGIERFIINAGGNVVAGAPYSTQKYSIGIEDPNVPSDIFTILYADHISVVTSGGYERFYEYEGKRYHHIIDPQTLYPANYMKSVTVLTKNSATADILSTVLFLMPVEEGMELIESFDDTEAIWYTTDDLVVRSSGVHLFEKE